MFSKQLWKQHAPFPSHKVSAGQEDDHHHPAAADGDHPQKAPPGNASSTWGKVEDQHQQTKVLVVQSMCLQNIHQSEFVKKKLKF